MAWSCPTWLAVRIAWTWQPWPVFEPAAELHADDVAQARLVAVAGSADPAVEARAGELCGAVPRDSKRPSRQVLARDQLRCGTRLGRVVLVVDVPKSTAYAALRHVTLCTRPHVRCTCPE